MLPEARAVHRTSDRLRLRIPDKKGDYAYFESLRETLKTMKSFDLVTVNASTGSALIIDKDLEIEPLAEFARQKELFALETKHYAPAPMARRIAAPIETVSSRVRNFTGGDLDLAGIAFVTLLGVGVYQLARGRFSFPPFYTAFWYAFGIFTKSLLDKSRA